MDHSFEAKVNFPAANDLGNILASYQKPDETVLDCCPTHARVIGLEKSDFDTLVGKVPFVLGKAKRRMVWRSVPLPISAPKSRQAASNRTSWSRR